MRERPVPEWWHHKTCRHIRECPCRVIEADQGGRRAGVSGVGLGDLEHGANTVRPTLFCRGEEVSGWHANAYDAAMLTIKAIEKVAKTGKDGALYIGKKAFRDAVFASRFAGISGTIACDKYGECAEFKPSVLEFTSADPKTFGIGTNPKKIWP